MNNHLLKAPSPDTTLGIKVSTCGFGREGHKHSGHNTPFSTLSSVSWWQWQLWKQYSKGWLTCSRLRNTCSAIIHFWLKPFPLTVKQISEVPNINTRSLKETIVLPSRIISHPFSGRFSRIWRNIGEDFSRLGSWKLTNIMFQLLTKTDLVLVSSY